MEIYISLEPIDGVEMYDKIKKDDVYNDVISNFNDDTVLYVSNIYTAYLLNNCCFSSIIGVDTDIPKLHNVRWFQQNDSGDYEEANYFSDKQILGNNIFDNHMNKVMDDFYTLLMYYD